MKSETVINNKIKLTKAENRVPAFEPPYTSHPSERPDVAEGRPSLQPAAIVAASAATSKCLFIG